MAEFNRAVEVTAYPNVRVEVEDFAETISLRIGSERTALWVREAKALRKALKRAIKVAELNLL